MVVSKCVFWSAGRRHETCCLLIRQVRAESTANSDRLEAYPTTFPPLVPPHETRTLTFTDCWKLAERWWYVLRYHRPSQLFGRATRLATQRLPIPCRWCRIDDARTPVGLRDNPGFKLLTVAHVDSRNGTQSELRADCILDGRFIFLNEERRLSQGGLECRDRCLEVNRASGSCTLSDPERLSVLEAKSFPQGIDWRADVSPPVSHLWRFHLHYHEFLLDIAKAARNTGNTGYLDAAWRIVADWIIRNPLERRNGTRDAWHPYCISRRLPIWMMLWETSPPCDEMAIRVRASMAAQAQYLSRHLEWDLRGNHLLENTKALAIVGGFFAGEAAERWLNIAERIIREEMSEQLLPDGQHFERSPMYHALMLQALLDVRDVAAPIRPALAQFCQSYARKMTDWLKMVIHPDGRIPLLSDSTFDETPDVGPLLARTDEGPDGEWQPQVSAVGGQGSGERAQVEGACERSSQAVAKGDIWTWRDGGDFLIFDAGAVGADHLPAHAHSDLLTIEASLGGKRFIVDSGTFDYSDGSMREYCRSTRAHNVLQVDDAEQCDMWSRFRMGYRGWPRDYQNGCDNGFAWARAYHNAYRRSRVPLIGRWIACRPGGPWVCLDWARGRGVHQLTSWLHLHPDVQLEQTSANEIELSTADVQCRLRYLTSGQLTIDKGRYCPEFGRQLESSVLKWTTRTELPGYVAWSLNWDESQADVRVCQERDRSPTIVWADGRRELCWRPVSESFAGNSSTDK